MPAHTDRGLLVVHPEADGTTTLSICANIVDGKPANVYARYHHARHVEIDTDIALTTTQAGLRYSDQIVEVASAPNGVVSVRYPRYVEPPAGVN